MSSIPLLLFIFLLQNLPATSHLLFSVPPKKKFALLIREKRETETEREEKDWERLAWASTTCISTAAPASPPPGWVRSACFFFFFFSYLLVLIQIYFKNWILFCGLCFVFGLVLLPMNRSLSFLFFFSHFIWFMRKKEATATKRMRE